jgi:hypothetical protein
MKKAPAAFSGHTTLGIAGFGLCFKSDHRGIISVLSGRYGGFIRGAGKNYCFKAVGAPGRQNPFKPSVELRGNRLGLKRGDFEAVLDTRTGAGTLKAAPNEQCLDAFLRSLISSLLLRSGGFMLHSAGLLKDGKAYIFLGKSGAGKSTLSKLAASVSSSRPAAQPPGRPAAVEVISDEINLLRYERGRFRVYGSPFWGEMRADGRPGSWPLGGIYILKKARCNRLSGCGKAEALKLLLRCLLNFEKGATVSQLVLANAAGVLAGVKFSLLEFAKKDASFLELVG